jgi:hypothetical protein
VISGGFAGELITILSQWVDITLLVDEVKGEAGFLELFNRLRTIIRVDRDVSTVLTPAIEV